MDFMKTGQEDLSETHFMRAEDRLWRGNLRHEMGLLLNACCLCVRSECLPRCGVSLGFNKV